MCVALLNGTEATARGHKLTLIFFWPVDGYRSVINRDVRFTDVEGHHAQQHLLGRETWLLLTITECLVYRITPAMLCRYASILKVRHQLDLLLVFQTNFMANSKYCVKILTLASEGLSVVQCTECVIACVMRKNLVSLRLQK